MSSPTSISVQSSASTITARDEGSVSPPPKTAASPLPPSPVEKTTTAVGYQPLATTPTVQGMNNTLARNIMRFLDSMEPAAAAEGEGGEGEVQVEIAPSPKPYKGKGKARASSPSPPPPPPPPAPPAKSKTSPRLRIPARIWNAAVVGRASAVQTPASGSNGESSKRKRVDDEGNEEEQEQEQAEQAEEEEQGRGRSRIRRKTWKVREHEIGESSRAAATAASSSRGKTAAASTSSRSSRKPASKKPTARKARHPAPPAPPASPPPQLPLPSNEGPRAAWRRLFPDHGKLSSYEGGRGAWREKMSWTKERGWFARDDESVYAPGDFEQRQGRGAMGYWIRRDEALERAWERSMRALALKREAERRMEEGEGT